MPSAKAFRVSERKRNINQPLRSRAKNMVTRTRRMIAEGDLEGAEVAARGAVIALDKAANKGAIHKNTASRKKSRLIRHLNDAKNN
ncbi:MAG: 30S ribosomal protein S20 [Chloroflexota bacterium]|nr:30S ribosomal protein S20 [Chloroflexota bacterium]MED5450660.1 30S ribosomal protein S20 [Chloroflexota bacterium]MED6295693.1 30S ribosomal protein S20 [Chloroflexota bacterium]